MATDEKQILKDALTKVGVPPAVVTWFTDDPPGGLGMQSNLDFRDYVRASDWENEWSQVLSTAPEAIKEFRNDRLATSRVRQAWRVIHTGLEGDRRKTSEVVDSEKDAPLPEPKQKELKAAWDHRYHLNLWLFVTPAASLVGRLYREYQANSHTVLQMRKVRSLYMQHLPSSSKTVDIGGVQMHVKEEETQVVINNLSLIHI